MSELVTLSCPSCGAKLQIGTDIDRFACAYCGNEHIVRRSGGVVSLAPVVESLQKVRQGVDKTASELAIQRLREELDVLRREKHGIESAAGIKAMQKVLWGIGAILGAAFSVFWVAVLNPERVDTQAFCWPFALILLVAGIVLLALSRNDRARAVPTADNLSREIVRKEQELAEHERVVSLRNEKN